MSDPFYSFDTLVKRLATDDDVKALPLLDGLLALGLQPNTTLQDTPAVQRSALAVLLGRPTRHALDRLLAQVPPADHPHRWGQAFWVAQSKTQQGEQQILCALDLAWRVPQADRLLTLLDLEKRIGEEPRIQAQIALGLPYHIAVAGEWLREDETDHALYGEPIARGPDTAWAQQALATFDALHAIAQAQGWAFPGDPQAWTTRSGEHAAVRLEPHHHYVGGQPADHDGWRKLCTTRDCAPLAQRLWQHGCLGDPASPEAQRYLSRWMKEAIGSQAWGMLAFLVNQTPVLATSPEANSHGITWKEVIARKQVHADDFIEGVPGNLADDWGRLQALVRQHQIDQAPPPTITPRRRMRS